MHTVKWFHAIKQRSPTKLFITKITLHLGVMVTIIRNEHSNSSSNLGWNCLHFTYNNLASHPYQKSGFRGALTNGKQAGINVLNDKGTNILTSYFKMSFFLSKIVRLKSKIVVCRKICGNHSSQKFFSRSNGRLSRQQSDSAKTYEVEKAYIF